MNPKILRLVIISTLLIVSSWIVWNAVRSGGEKLETFFFHIAIEMVGSVITVVLFDVIIGSRLRRNESRSLFLRDLYSDEQEIRVYALDQLLKDNLLKRFSLNKVDFSAFALEKRSFDGIRFFKCKFFGTQLEGVVFRSCHFEKCDFSGANLNKSSWTECMAEGCLFSGAFFEETVIRDTKFNKSNFTMSRFIKTILKNTAFIDCSATKIVISGIDADTLAAATFTKQDEV